MGILDDIKNMKPVSDKVFTVNDLIKIMNGIRFSSKGNKSNENVNKESKKSKLFIGNGIKDQIKKYVYTKEDINYIIKEVNELEKQLINNE